MSKETTDSNRKYFPGDIWKGRLGTKRIRSRDGTRVYMEYVNWNGKKLNKWESVSNTSWWVKLSGAKRIKESEGVY